ncbi:MAG: hypothetical protein M1831_007164 [Alyxoria varia]|nr:MAG: hypothetical protein M1831_007164 [Alyxoria varia]
MSSCRGTYGAPESDAPLCHAPPAFVVSSKKSCQNCEYQKFCNSWESRINEAQEKRTAAGQMISDIQLGQGSCAVETDSGEDDGFEDTFGFGDADLAFKERQRADQEVAQLQTQFQREQWIRWRPFLDSTSNASVYPRRPRRKSSKCSGSSPLKKVTSPDELNMEATVNSLADDLSMLICGNESPSETSSVQGSDTISSPSSSVSLDLDSIARVDDWSHCGFEEGGDDFLPQY